MTREMSEPHTDGKIGVFGGLPIFKDPWLPPDTTYLSDFYGNDQLVLIAHRPWTRRERVRRLFRRLRARLLFWRA